MFLGIHDPHDVPCARVVSANSILVLCKAAFNLCCYARIERAIFALKQIDKIHVLKIAHFAVKKICELAE